MNATTLLTTTKILNNENTTTKCNDILPCRFK
jgi:hypothetical protein